jgi:hypothetical protein
MIHVLAVVERNLKNVVVIYKVLSWKITGSEGNVEVTTIIIVGSNVRGKGVKNSVYSL